jgi:hypothetical protein
MTLEQVKRYFGNTGYEFAKRTKMHHSAYKRWEEQGFIPIKTQYKLQILSMGALRAEYDPR